VQHALAKIPEDRREAAHLIYTAHSIPLAMAQGCDYEKQLKETGRLVAEELGHKPVAAGVPEPKWSSVSNLGWSRTFLIACVRSKSVEAVPMW
jgi:hypothetical protein